MGRQSRIKSERRASGETGYVAFAPHLTREVMGAARLMMPRLDVEEVVEMVATASPSAQAHFAVSDAAGVGVTLETAAYDIAYMAVRRISSLRKARTEMGAVHAEVAVLLGDHDVTLSLVQERRGGDVIAQIAATRPHAWTEEDEAESAFIGRMAAAGVTIVTFGHDGAAIELTRPQTTHNF